MSTSLVGDGIGGVGYGSPMDMRIPQAELGSALSALGSSALGWSLGVGVGGVFSARIKTQTQCQMGFSEERKKIKKKIVIKSGFSLHPYLHWRVNSTDGQSASKRFRSDGG